MDYITSILNSIKKDNPHEEEFYQAVNEMFSSVSVLFNTPNKYVVNNILKRISEPDRQIKFRVTWKDDNGNIRVNRGYRVQFSNALGPYKGGLRFHPTVNLSVMKFLAFEQMFKNALTGLPLGGAKGGSDFNPKGKSDNEIMNFCQSFMTELFKYIDADIDVPAGDIGVGQREVGYLFGQYKRIKNSFEGSLTGKSILFGGSVLRKEATGYGLLYITQELLNKYGYDIKDKKICISGSGNVAIYAAEKAIAMGAKVIVMSDSDGWIYDEEGIDIKIIKEIKENKRLRISEYQKLKPSSKYTVGKFMWDVPCDVALPCATQNELDKECIENLIIHKVIAICEGANMPITYDGLNRLLETSVLYIPGKASNAGGVAVSGLEMSQNSSRMAWTLSDVDNKLKNIMKNIFETISNTAEEYGDSKNYFVGSNIAGFKKVADALILQGAV